MEEPSLPAVLCSLVYKQGLWRGPAYILSPHDRETNKDVST